MILFECALYFFFFPLNKKKCERYWPEKPGQRFVCEPFAVYCVSIVRAYTCSYTAFKPVRFGSDFRCCELLCFAEFVKLARKVLSWCCFLLLSQDSEENKDDYLSRTLRVTFSNVGPAITV